MKLFLVEEYDRDLWGYSHNVVRANDEAEAVRLCAPHSKQCTVTELDPDGEPAILWCHDESPDSPRGG